MLIARYSTGESAVRKEQIIIINGLHYHTSLLLSHQFAGRMRRASVQCVVSVRRGNMKVKEDKISRSRQQ